MVLVESLADGEADGVGVETDVAVHEARVIATSTQPTRLALPEGRRLDAVPVSVSAWLSADLQNFITCPVLHSGFRSVGYSVRWVDAP